MAKIKINKKELEKMLKEQLGCKSVSWDKEGNANVELDLDEIKKQEVKIIEKTIIKESYPWIYPIYTKPIEYTPNVPYWGLDTRSNYMSFNSIK